MKVLRNMCFLVGVSLVVWPHPTDPVAVYRWGYFTGAMMGVAAGTAWGIEVERFRKDRKP